MSAGRIRTLKPENWQDEALGRVSREARLLRDVLITIADDDGRWRHLPSALIGHGYPYDEDVTPTLIHEWASQLAAAHLIFVYESDGIAYGCFPTWHKHQVINRHTPSKLPGPKGIRCAPRNPKKPGTKGSNDQPDSRSPHGTISEPSRSPHGALTERSSPDQRVPCSYDPVPVPVVEDRAGARADLGDEKLNRVVAILRTCPRFQFDPGFVGVANMLSAHPNLDHDQAAHTAAARGADPVYRTTSAARAFEFALRDQAKDSGQHQRRPLAAVDNDVSPDDMAAIVAFRKKAEAEADRRKAERQGAA